jgi:hypothetical protein
MDIPNYDWAAFDRAQEAANGRCDYAISKKEKELGRALTQAEINKFLEMYGLLDPPTSPEPSYAAPASEPDAFSLEAAARKHESMKDARVEMHHDDALPD